MRDRGALIRLGEAHDSSIMDDGDAREAGTPAEISDVRCDGGSLEAVRVGV